MKINLSYFKNKSNMKNIKKYQLFSINCDGFIIKLTLTIINNKFLIWTYKHLFYIIHDYFKQAKSFSNYPCYKHT